LLPHLDVKIDVIRENLSLVMPKPAMLLVSARTGEGIDRWVRWLKGLGHPRSSVCATGVSTW
jgi:hydrogenase nickel incorporation protein HypB